MAQPSRPLALLHAGPLACSGVLAGGLERDPDAARHAQRPLEVPNLQELDLDRVIAYGHTWSPTLELTPDPPMFHEHAINVDMAFSATIAEQRGYISVSERDGIFWLMSRVGLSLDSPHLTPELLERATSSIIQTRKRAAQGGRPPADRHVLLRQRPDDGRARRAAWDAQECRPVLPSRGRGARRLHPVDVGRVTALAPRLSPSSRPVTPVGILVARLEVLRQKLDVLDPALAAELEGALEIVRGLDPYLEECTTAESPALRLLFERTQDEDWAGRPADAVQLEREMVSGHVEGQLLKMLVHATRAQRVLEIGMFTGYSALAMAEALPADGVVVACEIDPEVAAFALRLFQESASGGKVDVRVGPGLDTLRGLAADGASFDLVFLDADKGGYVDYLAALLETDLLAPHALVCVDNTLMQGQPYGTGERTANGDAIATFNRVVAADPRVEQVLVPLRDGLTLIRQVAAG